MTPDPTPPPPEGLTRYLQQLATHVGYQVDWAELNYTCGHQPQLVTAWVSAAAAHAALNHTRRLLPTPAEFLRERVGQGEFDNATGHDVELLFGLHEHDQQLQSRLARTKAHFTSCCRQLTTTALTSPLPDHTSTTGESGHHRGPSADPPT